ncbi:hypothetical protein F0562_002126 [Nyssa sinensis]|uniref:Uncharacterized protein n=1 Tax=Nyssa sinensis TaxID=561372 RepID=A0A5J5C8U4_9ASTE|nr:hypothetical protein F0562_002126 [Nyssa sinensis]
MDNDVVRWILEFLFRESVDDRVLNAFVRVLPLSNFHPSFTKTMLLRRIESAIANGSVSVKILGLLEFIEELDYQEGIAVSEVMKAAYCAVAVACTVRVLEESEDKERKYFEAVKRIWRGRVWKMEKTGLISDELRSWKDDIDAAVWDASVSENLPMRLKGIDAVKAVSVYVAEAWERMGPSFLELVTQTMSYDTMREVLGLDNDQVGDKTASHPDAVCDLVASDCNKEIRKGNVLPKQKPVALRRSRGAISGTSRGVKITDTEELGIGTSNNNDFPPTPEVNKVQEALKSSSLELQAVVKDPLPDALQLAETIVSGMGRENMNHEISMEDQTRVDVDVVKPSVEKSPEAVLANERNLENQCCSHQNKVSKSSLMERNSTAHTHEWEDSIGALPEESPNCRGRIHLPSPKRRIVSPLKKYEITKLVRRRKIKKWSQLEEDTLRTGVQKYGKGNWKLILNSYRDIFDERTEVDLKDKWRNMVRY